MSFFSEWDDVITPARPGPRSASPRTEARTTRRFVTGACTPTLYHSPSLSTLALALREFLVAQSLSKSIPNGRSTRASSQEAVFRKAL